MLSLKKSFMKRVDFNRSVLGLLGWMLLGTFTSKRFVSLAENLRRMGRRNRAVNKFAQRKRDKKAQEFNPSTKPTTDTRKPYEEIVRENASFEEYYKSQKICPEDEWAQFMTSLRESLPTAFRITGSKGEANELLRIVKSEYFSELLREHIQTDGSGEEIKPINLPWYPGGLAWQLRVSRTDIRRNETLYKLHNFLVAETAAGGVSRQETVSMIPPVVLQVEPHHKVLDMCAAPGSKTAQLIEFLHADEDKMPTGLVMANDVDNSRCYMLVHQAKRLNSPCVLVVNHDAATLPALQGLQFDRVLCDVPCSGDGTLRKNPDIWPKWSVANGNNLHGVQFRIARRGCELLAVGGRLVYSTCSFNPVENEAVVHRLLRAAEGAVRLADATHLLPGLRYQRGLSHWRPTTRDMVQYESFEDVPEQWRTVLRPQMFPPAPHELPLYPLDKCIRILPHHQDTGGFFVAVFEKVDLMPWEKKNGDSQLEAKKDEQKGELLPEEQKGDSLPEKTEERKEPPKKRRRMGGYKEDPFVFFSGEDENVFISIKEYYELSDEFDAGCLLTRCRVGKKKNIYLVSPAVRDLVRRNEERLKIINTGVRAFVRCDNNKMACSFRLSQEGLPSVLGWVGEARRVAVQREDLVTVLQCDTPNTPPALSTFSPRTQVLVRDLAVGSCVLQYGEEGDGLRLSLVGWRGVHSLRAYTAREDTVHYLRLLGADYSKYDVNKFKKASTEVQDEVPEAKNPSRAGSPAGLPARHADHSDHSVHKEDHTNNCT